MIWSFFLSFGCATQNKDNSASAQDTSSTGTTCMDDAAFFETKLAPIVESKCLGCHVEGGVAAETRFLLIEGEN